MICPNCGCEINDGSAFCPSCGVKLPDQPVYPSNAVYNSNMNTNMNNVSKSDNTGITAMVLGIVACACSVISLVVAWWLCIVGLVCGIIGVICGNKASKQPNVAYAKPGKILSIVGLCVSGAVCAFVVVMICWVLLVAGAAYALY